ncbi:HEAT repeat-containing protein 6 [Brachionichthys hirsutus]|uniref:HEAT repeat-containing protein 6 n=1 Tax=Brachionichthys hirsutus TaxID=412623 RepID=UPI003605155B
MAGQTAAFTPFRADRRYGSAFPPAPRSAEDFVFAPHGAAGRRLGCLSDAEMNFARCAAKLRSLRAGSGQLREELNLLLDKLLSENYNRTFEANSNIKSEDVCSLLKHVSSLVPLSQEHLVVKLCQLVHRLLTQLRIIMDEKMLDGLLSYTAGALKACGAWTHSDILLAIATLAYGNGCRCRQHLGDLLDEDGVLRRYSSPSQPNIELRQVALTCLANVCLKMPGKPPLDDHLRSTCLEIFLNTLQSPRPADTDELFYCLLIKAALKGLQFCFCEKSRSAGEDLGSTLALLKRFMFMGAPGVSVEWPPVLYPTPLPQYECFATPQPDDAPSAPPKDATLPGKTSGNKKKKSRGKGKKTSPEESRGNDEEEDDQVARPSPQKGVKGEGETKGSAPFLYPSWKRISSDSEISDSEGSAQNKLRFRQGRVRQGALLSLLSLVRGLEKRTLYGYWSSFIPDSPSGGPPPLTLVTVILKDSSPKVRLCALQVLSAMLEGSRQFLAVAEDTASPRTSYTPLSFTLAAAVRELHRDLSLAVMAESSPQTLTQVIKCLAHLVTVAPYHRLRPGLLGPLWKQMRPLVRHRDVNVRVAVLTLYGALVMTQAPLPEIQLLLQQPEGSSGAESPLSWRKRDLGTSPSGTPLAPSQKASCTNSPCAPPTPGEQEVRSVPWLIRFCVSLVTHPGEDQSDGEGRGAGGGAALEHASVRVEALQVMSRLVRGYFSIVQAHLFEVVQVSTRCLGETDPSIQLHGTKLLEELGTAILQQYKAENNVPEDLRVPESQVLMFWSDILSGPLNRVLQNGEHWMVQASACDTLASILPQVFSQLPEKTKLMCITVLLGLAYSDKCLVRTAAVGALGLYVMFPCLGEDVMFLADTANALLAALEDPSRNVRFKASWCLGNLTDTLIVNMQNIGLEFQEEISDMLLLKMLHKATRATSDKDKVKYNAVRTLGNLLHFLRQSQVTRSVFRRPLEEAVHALVKAIQSDAIMKVRWNACCALGNAFRNPALALDSAPWSRDAFSSLCHVVTSCTNFKVRIKSAAALAVPNRRSCYGDTEQFSHVWRSLATPLDNTEDANDFLEYRFSASLRRTLSQALLHLLGVSQSQDMPSLGESLSGEEGIGIKEHLINYVGAKEIQREDEEEKDVGEERFTPQQRVGGLQQLVLRLKGLKAEGEWQAEEERGMEAVVRFLEDLLKTCEEL